MNYLSTAGKGMFIVIVSTMIVALLSAYSGLDYMDPLFAAHYFPYEAFLAVVVVILYLILLRKAIPLNFKIEFNKTFFITLPLIIIPLAIMMLSLTDAKSIDEQMIWMILGTAISVGIAEELIFRVAGYRVLLASGRSARNAILLSAVLFSLFHLTNLLSGVPISTMPIQLVNTFMLGVVLAYIYFQTKSILYPMIIHTIWDFSAFIGNAFGTASLLSATPFLLTLIYFVWALIHTLKLKNPQQRGRT